MNNLVFKTKTENESVNSVKKTIFKYKYSPVTQTFVENSSNCKDLEDICHKSINSNEAKKILYDLSKIITEGYYKKKSLDVVIFKSYNIFICVICSILSCISLYLLFASVQYYPKKENAMADGSEQMNVKNNYLKLNRTDICKDYIKYLLTNKSIEIIDQNYSDAITNYNSTIPIELYQQVKFNTTLIEKIPEVEDNVEYSLKFVMCIILSTCSLVCVMVLFFINYFDSQNKMIPVEDIVNQNLTISLKEINKKYNEYGFNFDFYPKNKELEVTYTEAKTGFFKRKNE